MQTLTATAKTLLKPGTKQGAAYEGLTLIVPAGTKLKTPQVRDAAGQHLEISLFAYAPHWEAEGTNTPDELPAGKPPVTEEEMEYIGGNVGDLTENQYRDALSAFKRYNMTDPWELAHFISQCAHETGGFRWFTELWGPTKTQRGYEGRRDLGNTQPGDGKRFRGGGAIHTTGRFNYTKLQNKVGDPKILQQGAKYIAEFLPWTAGGSWWEDNKMQARCLDPNQRSVANISRCVNQGPGYRGTRAPNGLKHRQECFNRAYEVFELVKYS